MREIETGRLVPYLTEMFRIQAWVALGKVMNPLTGQIERNLPVAREVIDLLSELETRTEDRRSRDETRLLQGALTELRLNYLEELKKPAPPVSEPPAGDSEPSGTSESSRTGEAGWEGLRPPLKARDR